MSIAVTAKDSWVVGARTFKGNPYDGHTLEEAFDQIKAITDRVPKQVYVDRGYRAAYLGQQTDVIITGQKRHSKATKRWMKRRNSVEPIIGHLKADHRMDRCHLKGEQGDRLHAVLCAAGYNIRWLLRMIARKGVAFLLLLYLRLCQAVGLSPNWPLTLRNFITIISNGSAPGWRLLEIE